MNRIKEYSHLRTGGRTSQRAQKYWSMTIVSAILHFMIPVTRCLIPNIIRHQGSAFQLAEVMIKPKYWNQEARSSALRWNV